MQVNRFMIALAAGVAWVAMLPASSQAAPGYRECTERCYVKECGEMGVRCPTETQKRMYRRFCAGKCREIVRKARVEEMLRIERERAARAVRMLKLKHKLWLAKKRKVAMLRRRYLAARRQRQHNAASQHYRSMLASYQEQLQLMRQKLQSKEQFYQARQQLRHKERNEMLFQVKRLKNKLAAAKKKGQAQATQQLKQELASKKKKEIKLHKKASRLRVDYYKTRVARRKHEVKQIKEKKKLIQEDKKVAKKQKDQKKLEQLAKQLGELAGRQAAVTQKADLEKIKLQQAQMAYLAASKRTL